MEHIAGRGSEEVAGVLARSVVLFVIPGLPGDPGGRAARNEGERADADRAPLDAATRAAEDRAVSRARRQAHVERFRMQKSADVTSRLGSARHSSNSRTAIGTAGFEPATP